MGGNIIPSLKLTWHLKINPLEKEIPIGKPSFLGAKNVSFRECNPSKRHIKATLVEMASINAPSWECPMKVKLMEKSHPKKNNPWQSQAGQQQTNQTQKKATDFFHYIMVKVHGTVPKK